MSCQRVFVRSDGGDVINSALSLNNEVMQMTKAPLTAYQAALRARMITATTTLMHQRVIKATKEALRAQGLRVSNYSHREISLLAIEYAKRNGEELINEAAETIERWRTEGFFGKRRSLALCKT
jgi:hypothetical protein